MRRRDFLGGTAALTLASVATGSSAPAQGTGEASRIIFPFAAGGSGDALARLIAEHLRVALDQPTIVENRTGAAGRLGVQGVKSAAPDGKTLLLTPVAPMSVYSHVYPTLADNTLTGPTNGSLLLTSTATAFSPSNNGVIDVGTIQNLFQLIHMLDLFRCDRHTSLCDHAKAHRQHAWQPQWEMPQVMP